MVLTVKVVLKNAQKVKEELKSEDLYNNEYKILKEGEFLFIPITKKIAKYIIANKNCEKIEKLNSIKDYLKDRLKNKELELMPSSYDVVGDIAILELDQDQTKIEMKIANAILQVHKKVRTVVKKASEHGGEFRIRKTKYIAGDRNKVTVHRESGVQIKLDIDKAYFSVRSSNERLRIAHLIRTPENVLVMFSGVAPYGLVIAKNSRAKRIVCIEKNPIAHKYALENIKINSLTNVEAIKGDVKKIIPTLNEKFNRIIMPLPKTAMDFLPLALNVAKKGTEIHLYLILETRDIGKICRQIKQNYKNIRIIRKVQCGTFSPTKIRMCFDLRVQ